MSNKAKCPYCRRLIEEDATKCPWCHSDTNTWAENNSKNKMGFGAWVVVITIIVAIIGMCSGSDNESSSNKNSSKKVLQHNKLITSKQKTMSIPSVTLTMIKSRL